MKNFSPFQIVIFVLCGLGIIFAVLMFSGKITIGKNNTPTALEGTVVVWGVLPADSIEESIKSIRTVYKKVTITYVQKQPATFRNELINAIASGEGPDMMIVTPADLIQDSNKLLAIPYTSLPDATFRSTFIDQGSLFLGRGGVWAFPLFVDPLMMYYNRDLLTSAFTVTPPKTWDEVIALGGRLTQKDNAGRFTTHTVALGTFDNITHAKDIIAAIMFQAGNTLVGWDDDSKKYISVFGNTQPNGVLPTALALDFYTSFSNPRNTDRYSWNASIPKDVDQFIAGNLGLYFGYASELVSLREKNPNLNFDIALFPQRSTGQTKSTYGRLYGIGILKSSKNTALAIPVAQQFATQLSLTAYLTKDPTLVPARKDMITATSPDNARQTIIYNSGIISQSWIDPDSTATATLFKRFVDQINAGTTTPSGIVAPMNSLLSSTLQKFQKDSETP